MNKIKKSILVLGISMVCVFAVQAQKFGYVNSTALLADLPEVKQMRSALEGLQAQLQKKGQQMVTDFQTKQQAAFDKQKAGQLSPTEEKTISEELQAKEQEILKFNQDMQSKLAQREQELLTPILDKANQAIKEIAESEGFQFIFDTSSGVLLFADESQDVTDKVKVKLGN